MRNELGLMGIIEFFDWMHVARQAESEPSRQWQREACRRAQAANIPGGSETHTCLAVHKQAGICEVAWSLGRSTVLYHSQDPRVTRDGTDNHSCLSYQPFHLADM
jgi:hypothetical protein